MSKSEVGQLHDAVETVLRRIQKANGYHTDLGLSVHRGFWAHVVRSREAAFPAVVIHPGAESIVKVAGSGQAAILMVEVVLMVAVELTLDASAYDELDCCTYDIRRAICTAREEICQVGMEDGLELDEVVTGVSSDSKYALAETAIGVRIVEKYA
ncbi:MAG: hypothetical protein CME38_08755 [Haliea sp.]|nr:hypothetical protein [Haliea sp.]